LPKSNDFLNSAFVRCIPVLPPAFCHFLIFYLCLPISSNVIFSENLGCLRRAVVSRANDVEPAGVVDFHAVNVGRTGVEKQHLLFAPHFYAPISYPCRHSIEGGRPRKN
jgi:hypothetical protein